MANAADIKHLKSLGLTVFPCDDTKRPRTPGDWRIEREYDWRESDLIGVAVPQGTVVLDIDNMAKFRATGLEVRMSAYAGTRREEGLHIYYRTDDINGPVAQVTEGDVLGYDTRVGGKGYVIAWDPQRWVHPSEWEFAPDWLYHEQAPSRPVERDTSAPIGTRTEILSHLGRIASRVPLSAEEYFGILDSLRNTGRIVALDPKRPWTDEDLSILAVEASKWEQVHEAPPLLFNVQAVPDGPAGMTAEEVLQLKLPPLRWRVPKLLPEGLGVIAAPPKTGKSVFAYQLGVELAFGGSVLGIDVPKEEVLYYALEDGPRRTQSRVSGMLRGRRDGLSRLHFRWTAPRLGGPLEQEVAEWLAEHPQSLVIIDVLAKVRPNSSAKSKNAYDEDYDALSGLQRVARNAPGSSILVVTHDRKAGSDDWMTRVTGTRGVTGSADYVIFINRKRGEDSGTVVVSGRDVEDESFPVLFDVTGWKPGDLTLLMDETRRIILGWVSEHGPAWQKDIAIGTMVPGWDEEKQQRWLDNVRQTVIRMHADGQLVASPDRLGYRAPEAVEQ
jgi:hypothetical protein